MQRILYLCLLVFNFFMFDLSAMDASQKDQTEPNHETESDSKSDQKSAQTAPSDDPTTMVEFEQIENPLSFEAPTSASIINLVATAESVPLIKPKPIEEPTNAPDDPATMVESKQIEDPLSFEAPISAATVKLVTTKEPPPVAKLKPIEEPVNAPDDPATMVEFEQIEDPLSFEAPKDSTEIDLIAIGEAVSTKKPIAIEEPIAEIPLVAPEPTYHPNQKRIIWPRANSWDETPSEYRENMGMTQSNPSELTPPIVEHVVEPVCHHDRFFFEGLSSSHPISFIKADLLYWVPQIGGMQFDFGTTSIFTDVIDNGDIVYTDEVDLDPSFKWNAGCRLACGVNLFNDLELGAFWTYFKSSAKNNSGHDSDYGKWKVTFNQIDFVTKYKICFSSFKLEPFVGIRGAEIFQKVNAILAIDIATPRLNFVEVVTLDNHQKFYGIGPEIGLKASFDLGRQFEIFGTVGTSVMYGKFKTNFKTTKVYPLSQFTSFVKQHTNAQNAAIDIVLGLHWEKVFCNNRILSFQISGEHHQYFNQNRLGAYGNLSLDGVTFSLGFAL